MTRNTFDLGFFSNRIGINKGQFDIECYYKLNLYRNHMRQGEITNEE